MMDPQRLQEISERDQLWASLRALRPEIDRIARGQFDGSEYQQQLFLVLGRIVAAELDFREKDAANA